jgi:hypothetical protein
MRRLSTEDLELIEEATGRLTDDKWETETPDILSPAERVAFERFEEAFEEVKRGF